VETTLLVVAVLAAYPALDGGPNVRWAAYGTLIAVAALGALAIKRLPWDGILQRRHGIVALYAWSLADIAMISIGIVLTGGGRSSMFWVYILTTLFFAASYPVGGQVMLLLFTVIAYLGLAISGGVSEAELALRLSVLVLTAFMATFLSRQLLDEMAAHAVAREESEHRRRCWRPSPRRLEA